MLGRVRAPSSSPDTLLRPPSKILKEDSLSIYEATLTKLKLGSRRSLDDAVEIESNCSDINASSETINIEPIHESMEDTIDTNCSSVTSDSILSSESRQPWRRNLSVVYMFSKYNSSRHGLDSSSDETMSGFASACSTCGECLSDDSAKEMSTRIF